MTLSRAKALGLLVAAAALAIALSILAQDEDSPSGDAATASGTREEVDSSAGQVTEPAADALTSGRQEQPAETPQSATREPETAKARGTIFGADSSPLEGALVTWSQLPERVRDQGDWQARDGLIGELESITDGDGRFTFERDALAEAEFGSVLWVTHPDYRAHYSILAETASDLATVQLEAAPRRWVTVMAAGVEVEGARVQQFAVPQDEEPDGVRARKVFRREWITGADGRAPLATFAGEEGLIAATDGERSRAVTRECAGDVTLELRPSFTTHGSVLLTDGADMPKGVRVFVEVGADDDWERDSSAPVRSDSTWGPMAIPLLEKGYRLVVEGGKVIRKGVYIPEPELGQVLNVDIETKLGIDQWFYVVDAETKELLPDAHIETYAQDELGRWVFVKHRPLDNGYILAQGCAPGELYYLARCPGHVFTRGGPVLLPASEPATLWVELLQSGRLEGRCTRDGIPVEDFKLLWWPGDVYAQLDTETFSGLADGRFALDSVGAGTVTVIAQSPEHGQSEPLTLTIPPGGTGEAHLTLPGAETGRGVVVDQATGLPIAGATIEALFTFGSHGVHPTGVSAVSDRDGHFEIRGLSEVPTTFHVTASGYALIRKTVRTTGSTTVDLGRLELPRSQPIEIRLHTAEGVDPTAFYVKNVGEGIPKSRFSPEGRVFVAAHKPGYELLEVTETFGRSIVFPVDLRPGEDWVIDIDLTGACQLDVHVDKPTGSEIPEDLWVLVKFPGDRGGADWTLSVPESGEVRFEGLPQGTFQVTLAQGAKNLASERIEVAVGQDNVLELPLNAPLRHFRVVDKDGRPLAATSMRFLIDGVGDGRLTARTDGQGQVSIGGVNNGEIQVNLDHPTRGLATGIPVERARTPDEVVDIVFEAEESLEVSILDGDQPISGIACRVYWSGSLETLSANRTSDSNGRVKWNKIGKGKYDLRAHHPNYWPLRVEVEAGETPNQVRIRRRGDLLFRATTATGSEASGLPVQVVSIEYETDVADWIQARAVKASLPLVTDSSGELNLAGLPRGEYRWMVQPPSGEVLSGKVTVRGGEQVLMPVRLP